MKTKICYCQKPFTSPKNGTLHCSEVCRKAACKRTVDRCNHRRYDQWEVGKKQCCLCFGFYHRVCTHARQRHNLSEAEYKKLAGLDRSTRQVISRKSSFKSRRAVKSYPDIIENLEKNGRFTQFKRGQPLGQYERSAETRQRLKEHIKRITKRGHG